MFKVTNNSPEANAAIRKTLNRRMLDKRRADLAHDTAEELATCARDGSASAYLNKPEDACPFGWETAQGIIWLQAWRLTMDRLGDA